eukprot:CAMPEP_0172487312 /NCGR_PEP_ID=MMETSP1066-20121228/16346_1 /TAXON_ID=671091 /ORGANISM="Coscinodiscus wailesii, Strain CCMP2513" /LENGTH=280 /DNA_ID=CAMNT_0013253849 /DNA_START=96 /DNA_END=938 /DNA_ORIENTATION=+
MAVGFMSRLSIGKKKKKSLSDIIMNQDWKQLEFECTMRGKRAKKKSKLVGFYDGTFNARVLPLHQMCAYNPPKATLLSVIEAHPRAVYKREHTFERVPLQIACLNGASDDVILTLLSFFKGAAEHRDVAGRVALHYACCNDVSDQVIKALLDAYPDAINCRDDTGWLPIHVACTSGASLSVIRTLLLARPQTILSKTKKGSNPLSCTKMGNGYNMAEVMSFLLKFESEYFKVKSQSFTELGSAEQRAYLDRAHEQTKDETMRRKIEQMRRDHAAHAIMSQ